MNKYNTEKEIADVLTSISKTLGPNEVHFASMLESLDTKIAPSPSPYTIRSSVRSYFFSGSSIRIASAFAVFVFILGGALSIGLKDSSLVGSDTLSQNNTTGITSDTQITTQGTLSQNRPSVSGNLANNQTQSDLAVASLKNSSASLEADELQNILNTELTAELSAHNDLLAVSDGI